MIWNGAFSGAIIAKNHGLCVPKLDRHGLSHDEHVEIAKLCLHICEALVADGAFIRDSNVFVIAPLMYAVTACHENDGFGRGEHIFATDRTVAICRSFDTFVGAFDRCWDTCAAGLAIYKSVTTPGLPGQIELTLQWKKSLPKPSPRLQIPQSLQ